MRKVPRSKTIAETTPLLPRSNILSHELPIFLRVCHSPWLFISQRALLALRTIIALFLTIIFTLDALYGVNHMHKRGQFAFEASKVSLMIQIIYYWITMSWSLQHILAPYGRLPPEEQAKGKFLAQIQACLSPPTSTDSNSKSGLIFLIFYTASVTFPLVVSAVYWLVLHPIDHTLDQRSKAEALQGFLLISITTLNSLIVFVEVFFLNSVQKSKDFTIQVAGVIAVYLLYAIWTVLGHAITGEYVYKYFDPDYAGWRGVATTDVVILSLTITICFAQRGLHELRETLVRQSIYAR